MNKNFYFDMDGVLVQYDRNAYTSVGEEPPEFLKKNAHYFRNLEPDYQMLRVIDILHENQRYNGNKIFIVTSVANNGAIFNEHLHDKIYWLSKWIPYIPIDDILISVTTKRDTVEYIHNHDIQKNDILIDDYNPNLMEWANAGGKAIKYLNGINSADSFDGLKICKADGGVNMARMLESINVDANAEL